MWTFAFLNPTPHRTDKRFLVWLRDRLAARDIPALGPRGDGRRWALSVNADDGYVFIRLDARDGGLREVIVEYVGAAEVEAEDAAAAVEAILDASPAVRRVEAA